MDAKALLTLDEIATWTSPMAQCTQLCVRSCVFQKSAVAGFQRITKCSASWLPESLRRYRKEGDVLSRIVTTDETWVFHYEPESKRRSMEWKHVSSPVKKKFKSQKSLRKVMLTVFWDRNGPITKFLGKGFGTT